MVTGTGIDLIEISRVREKIDKNHGFREYVFSKMEIAYCESKGNPYQHYAARFAAKEALVKALGTGLPGAVVLNEISVDPDAAGKPRFSFEGSTAAYIESLNLHTIHLSLTHTRELANAMVVIEK